MGGDRENVPSPPSRLNVLLIARMHFTPPCFHFMAVSLDERRERTTENGIPRFAKCLFFEIDYAPFPPCLGPFSVIFEP